MLQCVFDRKEMMAVTWDVLRYDTVDSTNNVCKTPTDDTVSIANNDNCSEGESTATLGNLGNTVNSNQSVF